MFDLHGTIAELRHRGSDTTRVEAKRAIGGLPDSLTSTMSALANLPGGGIVILGLDEATGFSPVALGDVAGLMHALVNRARTAFVPPIVVHVSDAEFEGHHLVVAEIDETPPSAKPCRLKQGGAAYLRFWDGDFQLSDVEVQGLWAGRTQPRADIEPVPGTSVRDLDLALVSRFLDSIRDGDQRFRSYLDDDDVLLKSGVVDPSGALTVAGLLALGDYPQQWFPNFVIQASAAPAASDPADTRVGDRARFSGPIPSMIDQAVRWTRSHSRRRVREDAATGVVRDSFDLPPLAMRELFANAAIHRDLAAWAQSRAVEVRLSDDQFVLTNPGGLYGITADRLGRQQLSSARNANLLRICQFVGLDDGNAVEALATGIPKILESVAEAGLTRPVFFDQALSFTVLIDRVATSASPRRPVDVRRVSASQSLTPSERRLLDAVGGLELSTKQLVDVLKVTPARIRVVVRSLVERGLLIRTGGQGHPSTTYRRSES